MSINVSTNQHEVSGLEFQTNSLPRLDEWKNYSLSEITDPNRPISYGIVQTGPNIINGIPCLRVVDIVGGVIKTDNLIRTSASISESYRRTVLKSGDLVIPLRGKVGEIGYIDNDLAGANLTRGVALISVRPDFSSKYVKHYLSSKACADRFLASMNGSALQEITISTLRQFKVSLPSLPEQTAIANALSDVDALIQELEKLIAKKQAIKTATMQQLLTGRTRLPAFGFEKSAHHPDGRKKGYKPSELGEIPEDWEFYNLPEKVWFQEGPGLRKWQFTNKGLKVINVTNLQENGFLDLDRTERHVSWEEFEKTYKHFACDEGDLVIASSGNSYCKVSIVRACDLPLLMNTSVIRFKPLDNFSKQYMDVFLKSKYFKDQIDLMITGGAQPNFGPAHLNLVKILAPTCNLEQDAVASIFCDMDEEIQALEQRLSKTRQIKQGMMQELLTGKTRLVKPAGAA